MKLFATLSCRTCLPCNRAPITGYYTLQKTTNYWYLQPKKIQSVGYLSKRTVVLVGGQNKDLSIYTEIGSILLMHHEITGCLSAWIHAYTKGKWGFFSKSGHSVTRDGANSPFQRHWSVNLKHSTNSFTGRQRRILSGIQKTFYFSPVSGNPS